MMKNRNWWEAAGIPALKIESIFELITIFVGTLFFGAWALVGTFFYIKALVELLVNR